MSSDCDHLWGVTHICKGENWIERGPYNGPLGRPTHRVYCECWKFAIWFSNILNDIERRLKEKGY